MIQVIGIGGPPASGKTLLARAILRQLGKPRYFRCHTMVWQQYDSARVIVLGQYDHTAFSGTDRLSMAVMPEAKKLMHRLAQTEAYHGWWVLFEGDRLFNRAFIDFLRAETIPFTGYVLTVPDETLNARHIQRGDKQSKTWLKGRTTKINTLREHYPLIELSHATPADTCAHAVTICKQMGVKARA